MKKAIAIAVSIAALAYVGLAFAAETSDSSQITTGSNQERKTELGQKRETFRQERTQLVADFKSKMNEWKAERQQALDKLKQEKQNFLENFKQKFTDEKCALIQKRVEERTSNFDAREGAHKKVYDNLVSRINKFISRFETAGLDTTNLKSYLATLQEKIDKFSNDYDAYIAKLKESKNLTCGHSEGEFKGTLVDARAELKLVHDDAADIRTYVRNTILSEIKTLKDKMPKEDQQNDKDKEENGSSN
jgi:hypothetical protein